MTPFVSVYIVLPGAHLCGLALAVPDGVLGDDLPLADLLGRPLHDAGVAHLVLQQTLRPRPPRGRERDLGARLHRPDGDDWWSM